MSDSQIYFKKYIMYKNKYLQLQKAGTPQKENFLSTKSAPDIQTSILSFLERYNLVDLESTSKTMNLDVKQNYRGCNMQK